MRRSLVAAVVGLLGCGERTPSVAPIEPVRRAPTELTQIAKSQAYQSRLSVDGIAFRDSTLFVTTNVGLLEVHGATLTQLYQWFGTDNVISGPWRDESHERIWVKRDHDNVLLIHDQAGWRKVAFPQPPSGNYTRGDILEGFRAVTDTSSFRLVGAGTVWKWSESGQWTIESRPPTDALNATIGLAILAGRQLHVVSSGGCAYLPCVNQGYWLEAGQWSAPIRFAIAQVEDVLATSNAVYIRGDKGELLRVDRDSVVVVDTPGPCEAIARTTDGKLIASFRQAGLFELDAEWRKLFDDPAPTVVGEQRVFLAERNGVIAYATTTVPHLKPGTTDKWEDSGVVGLWTSNGSRLVSVPLVR